MDIMIARRVVRNPGDYSTNAANEAAALLLNSVYATLDDIRSASQVEPPALPPGKDGGPSSGNPNDRERLMSDAHFFVDSA